MTDSIVQMPQPIAIALRRALDEWRAAGEQWIEKTITLAHDLKAARDACASDNAFHVWLDENGFGEDVLNRDTRAALLNMAKYDGVTRKILQLTERRSVRHIWTQEIKPIIDFMVSPRGETESERQSPSNSEEKTSPDPENSKPPIPPSDPASENNVGRRSALLARDFGNEIAAVFPNKESRATLGKLSKSSWKLVLRAYHEGLLPHPTETAIKNPNARLFFPYGSNRFLTKVQLESKSGRATAVDLLGQMIAHKDALLAEPERVEEILAEAARVSRAAQKAAIVQERAAKALAALPQGECEVIMFGKRLWPIVEGETIGAYDFGTLQVAVWKFTDLNRWMHRDSPGSRAINIRNSTKWDRHFIGELLKDSGEVRFKIDRIYQLVHLITRLMEENPDGECREPLTPLVLG